MCITCTLFFGNESSRSMHMPSTFSHTAVASIKPIKHYITSYGKESVCLAVWLRYRALKPGKFYYDYQYIADKFMYMYAHSRIHWLSYMYMFPIWIWFWLFQQSIELNNISSEETCIIF